MTRRPLPERRDYHLGPLHVIVRGYRDPAQYGALVWGDRRTRTLDVWIRQTLITFRRSTP